MSALQISQVGPDKNLRLAYYCHLNITCTQINQLNVDVDSYCYIVTLKIVKAELKLKVNANTNSCDQDQ